MLLANGKVYAGFGSFCDEAADVSRGWFLGWEAGTLTPLPANDLFDFRATSPNDFFLSSIWMSGYAPSVDDSGNVLAVTGNSDYSGTTYDGITNMQESVLKISSDLSSVLDLFTPADWASLDQGDTDFGSGGVMVLPDQQGAYPHLAVAAGKEGNLFLMNEDSLGGYSSSGNNVLGTYDIGGCWCGPSYYVDPSDSIPRVVTSGGLRVQVYQVLTSPSPLLNLAAQSTGLNWSRIGFLHDDLIQWRQQRRDLGLVSARFGRHPCSSLCLQSGFRFDTLKPIYNQSAGTWTYTTGRSNLVPVVANGEVFVASYKQLSIFGLTKAVTYTTMISGTTPANYGQSVILTAQVTAQGGGTPTGTVTFRNGTKLLGTVWRL